MSEFAYPLDGEQNYTAAQCGAFFAGRSSGVFSADGNLAVSVTGARKLTLSAGVAWINTDRFWGKVYCNTDAIDFVLPTADGALDMICRVVVRWNKTTNVCQALLLEGAPSSSPVAPTRSTTDELYDLVLADYLVQHGETEASAARLTDQRLNDNLCGLMRDGVERLPTDMLQAQAMAILEMIESAYESIVAGNLPPHAVTHAAGGADALTPAAIGAVPAVEKGATNGVATLDTAGKVAAAQASAAIVEKTAAYTIALTDAGKLIALTADTALTVTVPANSAAAFPIGTEIEIAQLGAGEVTVAAAEGVTVHSLDSSVKLAGQYAAACLKKIAADTWLLGGALE